MPVLRRLFYPVGFCFSLALPASSAPQQEPYAGAGVANITYTGFRLLPSGRSLIYVELSAPVDVRMSRRGTEVVYTLEGAQVPLKNNKNPLITSAFASNVMAIRLVEYGQRSAKAKQRKTGAPDSFPSVDLLIQLRMDVKPTHALVQGASGPVLEVRVPDAQGR